MVNRNRPARRVLVCLLTAGLSAGVLFGCTSDSTPNDTATNTATNTGSDSTSDSQPGTVGPTDSGSEPTVADTVANETVATETVASETVAGSAPSDQLAKGKAFVLQGDGVDDVKFGDDLGAVRETFVAEHGEPDADSGWAEQQAPCDGLGTKVRTLTWGDLVLEFSNGPTEFGPANSEHLIAYFSDDEAGSGGVVAPDGLPILDQTVAALRGRFPGTNFAVSELAGPEYHLPDNIAGSLTGLADTDTSQTFRAGLICID